MMDQAAALSGVFQAAELVDTLARTGQYDREAMNASISSIFVTSPQSVSEVYGGFEYLKTGRTNLERTLSQGNTAIKGDVLRYALALIHIEKKLGKNPKMLSTIANRLDRIQEQVNHFGMLHENVIASLASLYLDTISTFKTRIQVSGDASHLQNTANASRIRSALLAGIRSAMLWRQCGGSRWTLFMNRKKLLDAVKRLPA